MRWRAKRVVTVPCGLGEKEAQAHTLTDAASTLKVGRQTIQNVCRSWLPRGAVLLRSV